MSTGRVSIAKRARLFSSMSAAFVPPSSPVLREHHCSWLFSPRPSPGNWSPGQPGNELALEEHFPVGGRGTFQRLPISCSLTSRNSPGLQSY